MLGVTFFRAMNKILIILMACVIGYSAYAWQFLSIDASRPVLSIVTEDSYRQIPAVVAKTYLEITDYTIAQDTIEGSPPIPFLATGFDLGGFKNTEILALIDAFLAKGADIDASFEGYTALNGAVLANSPELVSFLVKRGASTTIKVEREGLNFCNGLAALEFAQCINGVGKQDLTSVIAILQGKT